MRITMRALMRIVVLLIVAAALFGLWRWGSAKRGVTEAAKAARGAVHEQLQR